MTDYEYEDELDLDDLEDLDDYEIQLPVKTKRMQHHYTDELELKSLLIRLKNSRVLSDHKSNVKLRDEEEVQLQDILSGQYTEKLNSFINNDIKRFIHIKHNLKEFDQKATSVNQPERLRNIQNLLKERIIRNSEITLCDKPSKEKFGEIIILMIKNILRKPNFQMLDYHDEFYSDQSNKIFKYLNNFDHTKISGRTGYQVNAFQYISQIIHNSVLFICNQRKRDLEKSTEYYLENPDVVEFGEEVGSAEDDRDIFLKLIDICPLEFPFNIEDQYPFVIKDLLNFIESNYNIDSKETIIERIMDYQETSHLGPVLVGDQIRSDEYLVKFVERFNDPDYKIQTDEW